MKSKFMNLMMSIKTVILMRKLVSFSLLIYD